MKVFYSLDSAGLFCFHIGWLCCGILRCPFSNSDAFGFSGRLCARCLIFISQLGDSRHAQRSLAASSSRERVAEERRLGFFNPTRQKKTRRSSDNVASMQYWWNHRKLPKESRERSPKPYKHLEYIKSVSPQKLHPKTLINTHKHQQTPKTTNRKAEIFRGWGIHRAVCIWTVTEFLLFWLCTLAHKIWIKTRLKCRLNFEGIFCISGELCRKSSA